MRGNEDLSTRNFRICRWKWLVEHPYKGKDENVWIFKCIKACIKFTREGDFYYVHPEYSLVLEEDMRESNTARFGWELVQAGMVFIRWNRFYKRKSLSRIHDLLSISRHSISVCFSLSGHCSVTSDR